MGAPRTGAQAADALCGEQVQPGVRATRRAGGTCSRAGPDNKRRWAFYLLLHAIYTDEAIKTRASVLSRDEPNLKLAFALY